MNISEKLILATIESDGEKALPDLSCLHLCYFAGQSSQLKSHYSIHAPAHSYMGILESPQQSPIALPEKFAEAVVYEVRRLGFSGVFADIENPARQKEMLPALDEALHAVAIPLFVPLSAEHQVQHAILTLQTDVSGGSLEEYVAQYEKQYGADRLAAHLVPICADYKLPTLKSGDTNLHPKDVEVLMQKYHISPFYSKELQCNYFTYMDEQEQGHFVVFDTKRTLETKIHTLTQMGISYFFIVYPDYALFLA